MLHKIVDGEMRKNTIVKIILFILPMILATGCLKDNPNPVNSFVTTDAINMLIYLESNGDVINSQATKSAFVNSQDLYSNLSSYVVLDIRDPQLFAGGHISGAINIQSSDLLARVKSIDTAKVILVSQNGQSASYYGGLLRLDGLNNVYILNFGMASWNSYFASYWNTYGVDKPYGWKPQPLGSEAFNSLPYLRGPYTDLPDVKLSTSGDIKSKIELRIQNLLSEDFEDGVNYVNTPSLPSVFSQDLFNSSNFSIIDSTFDDFYIICYDTISVYQIPGSRDVNSPDHPSHSVLYTYYNDLRSIHYLQTIPSNKKVVLYSLYGQQSAFATAYLRLLGYNARSLLYGATWIHDIGGYTFPPSMNYPYVN
jgi:rhodanese-related sulfurtransferase